MQHLRRATLILLIVGSPVLALRAQNHRPEAADYIKNGRSRALEYVARPTRLPGIDGPPTSRLQKSADLAASAATTVGDDSGLSEEILQGWIDTAWVNNSRTIYRRNASGDVTEELLQTWTIVWEWLPAEWVDTERILYSFDDSGYLILSESQEWDGLGWQTEEQTSFAYDASGRLVEEVDQWYGNNSSRRQYAYDEAGNVTEYLIQYWEGAEWGDRERWFWTYDDAGTLVEWQATWWSTDDLEWKNLYRNQYVTDSFGLLREITYLEWEEVDWIIVGRLLYVYDGSRNPIEATWQDRVGEDWVNGFRETGVYDEHGNMTLWVYAVWDGSQWQDKRRELSTFDVESRITEWRSQGWSNGAWVDWWRRLYIYEACDPIIVSNTGDSGSGSLRQAILDANASQGEDCISFAIPGLGPHTIQPLSPLPTITDTILIDGYTQPGAHPNTNPPGLGLNTVLMIELDGSYAGPGVNGLYLETGGSMIRGLAINRFGYGEEYYGSGILIEDGRRNTIQGNFIGTDITGSIDFGNNAAGVTIRSWDNLIGGQHPSEGNLISGNDFNGVNIQGGGFTTVVQGNIIGLDASGRSRLGNDFEGVRLLSTNCVIGGSNESSRNVISGNQTGIWVGGDSGGWTTFIQGNYIGTDVTGSIAVGNARRGVYVSQRDVGILENVISGNGQAGVYVSGVYATGDPLPYEVWDVRIGGNSIGTDTAGSRRLGNGGDGVWIDKTSRNRVVSNTIAFNGGAGVVVTGTREWQDEPHLYGYANTIESNSIFSNDGLGIDLGGDGMTTDDPGDSDVGPNWLQNRPEISSAKIDRDGRLVVTYRVDSDPEHASYPMDAHFFLSDGHGEGWQYLDWDQYSESDFADGLKSVILYEIEDGGPFLGKHIVATVTSGGSTSEFSDETQVRLASSIDLLAPANESEGQPPYTVFKWNAVDEAVAYELQVAIDRQFRVEKLHHTSIEATADTSDSALGYGLRHYWRVRAEFPPADGATDATFGPWSDVWSFTVAVGTDAETPPTGDLPTEFALHQNYPNPFNPSTSIAFDLPEAAVVRIDILDILGRLIDTLVDGSHPAGRHQVTWDAADVGSGAYFYRMTTPTKTITRSMSVVK